MIKIEIDWRQFLALKQWCIKMLIVKRAYLGYCSWLEYEKTKPRPYKEFKEFEFWKIELAFRQYLVYVKEQKHREAELNFRTLLF